MRLPCEYLRPSAVRGRPDQAERIQAIAPRCPVNTGMVGARTERRTDAPPTAAHEAAHATSASVCNLPCHTSASPISREPSSPRTVSNVGRSVATPSRTIGNARSGAVPDKASTTSATSTGKPPAVDGGRSLPSAPEPRTQPSESLAICTPPCAPLSRSAAPAWQGHQVNRKGIIPSAGAACESLRSPSGGPAQSICHGAGPVRSRVDASALVSAQVGGRAPRDRSSRPRQAVTLPLALRTPAARK